MTSANTPGSASSVFKGLELATAVTATVSHRNSSSSSNRVTSAQVSPSADNNATVMSPAAAFQSNNQRATGYSMGKIETEDKTTLFRPWDEKVATKATIAPKKNPAERRRRSSSKDSKEVTQQRSHNHSDEVHSILYKWLRDNLVKPYPTIAEKKRLAAKTKLRYRQVSYWYTNARRRLVPKMIEAENKRRAACDQPPLKVEAFTMSNCTSSSPCSSEESADAKTDYTFASPTDIPMETENSLAPRSLMLPSPCSISDKSTSTRSSSLPAIAFSPVGAISALRGALPHAQPIAWTGDRAAEPASSPSHKSTSAAAACHPSSSCHLESSATARISKGDKGDRKAQRPATLLPSHYITVQQQQQTNASPPSHSVSSIATPVHAEQPAPPVQPVQPVPNITIAPPAPPAASAMIVQAPTVSNTAMFSPATVRMPFQVVHQFPAAQPAAVAAAAAPMYKDPSTLSLAQASGSARFLPSSHVTVPRLQPLHVISVIPTASPMHIPASTIPYPPQHAMQLAPVQAVQTVQPAQQAAAAVALPQLQQQQQPPQIMVLQYTPTTSPNHPDTAAAVSVGHGSTASTAQSSPQYPVVTSTTQYRSADGQLYPIAIVPAPQQGIPVTTITHDT